MNPSKNKNSNKNPAQNEDYYDEESSTDEEYEGEQQFDEANFNFTEFVQRFANVKIVSNLTILLRQFETNSPELNHCVLKLFHRIAVECKMPAMLYQASIFRIFQKLFEYDNRLYKDLASFARFIFRGFVEVAKKNPKAFMELLFWKSTKQAVEMTDGYETQHTTSKKVARNMWTDTEEDELRTLFMEHQTNKYPRDLVDFLMENLINQDRTRRGVMKKLKEMCLIVNSKKVRDAIHKRLPKEWLEDEVAQLTELWEKLRDEDDPVGLIYDSLRLKRPKKKIKEKLLELNLADDPKQLRKKRTKKSSGPKSSWENPSDNDRESNSDSDSESDSESDNEQTAPATKKKKEKSKKKQVKRPTVLYSNAQLSGLLKDVIANDMHAALQWVKESLEESLEDRDEEDNEGLALVPLTAETSTAMEVPSFQRFLRALGIEPPSAEEAYWRIPASMLDSTIKKRYEMIEAGLRGEFEEEKIGNKEKDSESDDDDVFERLKKYSKKDDDSEASQSLPGPSTSNDVDENPVNSKSPSKHSNLDNDDSSSDSDKTVQSKKFENSLDKDDARNISTNTQNEVNKSNKKPIQAEVDSSSSEDEQENLLRNETKNKINGKVESDAEEESMEITSQLENIATDETDNTGKSTKSKRIRTFVDSDSENDLISQNMDETKRNLSDDSDSEKPTQKKRRIFDSDEDDEVPKNEESVEKKQVRVWTDDED